MTKVAKLKLKKIPKDKLHLKTDNEDITEIKFKKPSPNVILKKLEERKKNTLEEIIDQAMKEHSSWSN